MKNLASEFKLHSRISEQIYKTVGDISDDIDEGVISSAAARKIIKLVRNFNFNREILLERHRSDLISLSEFQQLEAEEGRLCIDGINKIMIDACVA